MKILLLVITFTMSLLASISAAEKEMRIFSAAFQRAAEWADPGTFSFNDTDGITYLTLAKGDLYVCIKLLTRELPQIRDGYKETSFDGVYVAEDGLSSVTVTGQFTDKEGYGTIAIHNAADGKGTSGTIDVFRFALSRLKTGNPEGASTTSP